MGAAQIDFIRVVAELGYVVVSIESRGTPSPQGTEWRRAVFGSLGPLSTEEQEAGLKVHVKQYTVIDADRVGIWGWSGGGSNTLNGMFLKPDSYHVGIGETNTHIQINEGLVDRLISLGKPFEYMVYPNRDHGLREGDGTVVHARMHFLRYLIDNLPPEPR